MTTDLSVNITWRRCLPAIVRMLKDGRLSPALDLLMEVCDKADRYEASAREERCAAEANEVMLAAATQESQ